MTVISVKMNSNNSDASFLVLFVVFSISANVIELDCIVAYW